MTDSEDAEEHAHSSVYVDTSAIARMLLDEPDKPVIEQRLEDFNERVASRLLRVELRRVGRERACSIEPMSSCGTSRWLP